jgi:CTD small phosphatase-like protein 2
VIVDNVAQNFQRQPENGIEIRSWYDDPKDNALAELSPILEQIANHPSEDLRVALSTYGD